MMQQVGLPFSVEEFKIRLNKVQSKMKELDLDCLLVTDPVDLYYLTAYRSHGYPYLAWQVLIVFQSGNPIMLTRHLEELSFRQQSWTQDLYGYLDHEDPIESTVKLLRQYKQMKKIGISKKSWYVQPFQLEQLNEMMPEVEFVDGSYLVFNFRVMKSTAEIKYIKEAARILSIAVKEGIDSAYANCTENDIAGKTLYAMIREGSETPATTPLIGVGSRSALGHSSWERNKVSKGDVIFLETGACIWRYHAASMRTICIGEPSKFVRQLEEASRLAVNAAIEAMKPGATSGDIDDACRGTVHRLGLGEHFHHRTGYSIGAGFIGWIDGPSLKKNDTTVLKPGMVFHIVPFLTDLNISVAISETVMVTDNGSERLTNIEQKIFVK